MSRLRGRLSIAGVAIAVRAEAGDTILARSIGGLGVELGEEDQLWLEQSTSVSVVRHPQAPRFNV